MLLLMTKDPSDNIRLRARVSSCQLYCVYIYVFRFQFLRWSDAPFVQNDTRLFSVVERPLREARDKKVAKVVCRSMVADCGKGRRAHRCRNLIMGASSMFG